MEGVTRLEGWPNWSKDRRAFPWTDGQIGGVAKREGCIVRAEGWPEWWDGQIRGVDRWEVVMKGVERWVVVCERHGQMEGG
jgi:hypothetical protein